MKYANQVKYPNHLNHVKLVMNSSRCITGHDVRVHLIKFCKTAVGQSLISIYIPVSLIIKTINNAIKKDRLTLR